MKIHTTYESWLNERLSIEKIQEFVTSFCTMYSDLDDSTCLDAVKGMNEEDLNILSDAAKTMDSEHEKTNDLSTSLVEKVEKVLTSAGAKLKAS